MALHIFYCTVLLVTIFVKKSQTPNDVGVNDFKDWWRFKS